MSGMRVLVTAGASRVGALVVAELERRDDVGTVIAVDEEAPTGSFARAEFVRLGDGLAQLPRVTRAADVEVLVDLRAAAALAPLDERRLRDHARVTERIVAACVEEGSTVARLVSVGSVHRYGWGADLPAFVGEDVPPPAAPRSVLGRLLAEIEHSTVAARAARPTLETATVRLADLVGPAGAGVLQVGDRLPLQPTVLGFDPPVQVVHEDDAARAVAHVVARRLDGPYLVAADGTLALSEALAVLGRAHAPVLPPWGIGVLARLLSRAGVGAAHELAGQLRRGRGIDNRRLKATGFAYAATSREALAAVARLRRDRRSLDAGAPAPYELEVEAFLRYSPSARAPGEGVRGPQPAGLGALDGDGLLALLPSLDRDALVALRAHELAGPGRPQVLQAIDALLRGD
jgi:UDP-glucose 4-epimerase